MTGFLPFDYQQRLAEAEEWPEVVEIPTGLGKTAAIIGAWVYRRFYHPKKKIRESTPRRLVYCLPMRVLVDQTFKVTQDWLRKIERLANESELGDQREAETDRVAVHLLMGGESTDDWTLRPDQNAILIGTQDMLLSRALNRGYAASRARWPVEFGLLMNDALWVMDEIQLMGNGLATTLQLDAFRRGGKQDADGFGGFGPSRFVWMSATVHSDWLETVDHAAPSSDSFELEESDLAENEAGPYKRLNAVKTLSPCEASVENGSEKRLAPMVMKAHQEACTNKDELTLVVVNTVERATALYDALAKLINKSSKDGPLSDKSLLLIHSRFRQKDRAAAVEKLQGKLPSGGRIVISTQVIEAGVDISAKTLFTELAPWASLVQRFGRCNRKGEFDEASIYWIDIPDNKTLPYESDDMIAARSVLLAAEGRSVGPTGLNEVINVVPSEQRKSLYPYRPGHVLRRKDLVELFDTTTDLAGNDIDVSRFIRENDSYDVQVCWRVGENFDLPESEEQRSPRREELCTVPVAKFKDFLKKADLGRGRAYRWDFLGNAWRKATTDDVVPGVQFLIESNAGGYDPKVGWTGKKGSVAPLPEENTRPEDSTGRDPDSAGRWQSIAQHTSEVDHLLTEILEDLKWNEELPLEALRLAILWHDRGKAHQAFQAKIKPEATRTPEAAEALVNENDQFAKAPNDCWLQPRENLLEGQKDERRKYFRHELASALALLQCDDDALDDHTRSLAAYLVAAHHGKVRLSIRSLPLEQRPNDGDRLFARGVWDQDELPATMLSDEAMVPAMELNLSPMNLGLSEDGEPSWAERMLRLRDAKEWGPFRLAYLEALLRAADRVASKRADQSTDTRKEASHE